MDAHRKFLHKLCLQLNYKTVEELINTMSAKELADWVEYYQEEKFLADRIEIQLATIADMMYKSHFKGEKEFIDFMVTVSQEEKHNTKEHIKNSKIKDALEDFN